MKNSAKAIIGFHRLILKLFNNPFAILAAITIIYILILFSLDATGITLPAFTEILPLLPVMIVLSLMSYGIRYLRWTWLLRRAGYATHWWPGYLAYLSGFAFTTTPGKIGELVRIRYLERQGVRAALVLSAFIYERAWDLLAVLVLAALSINNVGFLFGMVFVMLFLIVLGIAVHYPQPLGCIAAWLEKRPQVCLTRLAQVVYTLRDGLLGCRAWFTALDMLVSSMLGLAAWSMVALSFTWLIHGLDLPIPLTSALSMYPLAMLVGAASMLPGGLGTTEASLVALLSSYSVGLGLAALAAITIRLTSMWLAVLCGMFAIFLLETRIKCLHGGVDPLR